MASQVSTDKIASRSSGVAFTLPTADGTANQHLKTDGSGALGWATPPTGIALTGSTATWIPTITGADALTGTANFTYDGSILDVKNSGTASSIKLYCENANAHAQEIKAAPHSGSSAWTLTLPGTVPTASGQALTATTAGVASWASVGKIGQILQTVKTDTFTSSADGFADVTGLSIAITPVATSSKILILANVQTIGETGVSGGSIRLVRDSTNIAIATSAGSRTAASGGDYAASSGASSPLSTVWLDSPSSAVEITYKVQAGAYSTNTVYVNRTEADTDIINYSRTVSTITVMEVLA